MHTVHYCLDSEYDKAWCGKDIMQGGEVDLYNVTCLACLSAVMEAGNLARNQFEKRLRDSVMFSMWCSAWCLMWAAVGNQLYIDKLYDTGSVH